MFRTHWWSDSILGFRWAPPTIAMISHAVDLYAVLADMDGNAQLYASIGHSACQPKTFSCSVSQTPVFAFWSTCLVMCCLPLLLLLLLRIPSLHAHDTREHGRVTCVLEDLMHALSKLCPLSSTVLGSAVRSKKRGLEQFELQCPNCKVPGSQESSTAVQPTQNTRVHHRHQFTTSSDCHGSHTSGGEFQSDSS